MLAWDREAHGKNTRKYRYVACNTHEHSAKKRGVDEIMGKKYIVDKDIDIEEEYKIIKARLKKEGGG